MSQQNKENTQSKACPKKILDEIGSSFVMGMIGGGAWNFLKGARSSPVGDRLKGGFYKMKYQSLKTGGSFAVWSGIFASLECSLVHFRKKEDIWNRVFAGALTGGILAARSGTKEATKAAFVGGFFMFFVEYSTNLLNTMVEKYKEKTEKIENRK
ncbi:import inner membrane translocase subunit tim-17 [Anaeramoeba ignava]|uniref:Import inner membrane translocase subunit tim-17 n=1 Tax=Anaeramoeba ignava TaxID=1746090 RepID=A0A9Q0LS48_ANAIG|nr:import inner membrane translocase subunit tim-17 [Anaeramoeba ignava]